MGVGQAVSHPFLFRAIFLVKTLSNSCMKTTIGSSVAYSSVTRSLPCYQMVSYSAYAASDTVLDAKFV